jgi:predicted HAD superfamily Cof-like phosphohydrolase
MREEFEEVRAAMEEGSLAHIAQELADLLYTVYGTAVAYGIDLEPVYREVHNANMRKEGGGTANDGKILKPATWTPPDIETIIQAQVIAAHLVTSDGDDTEYVRNNPWLMHQIDASQQTYQGQP